MTEMVPMVALAEAISREHEAAVNAAREGLQHARRAGALLLEAKGQCAHGEWLPWVHERCAFSERTAQVYMRIARQWPELENPQRVADLPLRQAVALLAEPREAGALASARLLVGQAAAAVPDGAPFDPNGDGAALVCYARINELAGAGCDGLEIRLAQSVTWGEVMEVIEAAGDWQSLLAEATLRAQRRSGQLFAQMKTEAA